MPFAGPVSDTSAVTCLPLAAFGLPKWAIEPATADDVGRNDPVVAALRLERTAVIVAAVIPSYVLSAAEIRRSHSACRS